jgi:hypothetical protein
MSNPPSSTKQAKQSSHLAPRDELGAWQTRQAQEGLGLPASAPASWSAVAERRERSLASATPLSSVHRLPQTLLALAKQCRASLPTALQNAGATLGYQIPSVIAILVLCTGCLKFGDESELFHPNITVGHLENIEARSGMNLPEGSVGLAWYKNSTGIDPWGLVKIKIPAEKATLLLKSEPFASSVEANPKIEINKDRRWWEPQKLTQASSGNFKAGAAYFTWTLGQDQFDHILYVSWMTY